MKIIWNLVLVFMSIISLFYVVYFFLKIREHRSTRNKRRSNAEKAFFPSERIIILCVREISPLLRLDQGKQCVKRRIIDLDFRQICIKLAESLLFSHPIEIWFPMFCSYFRNMFAS